MDGALYTDRYTGKTYVAHYACAGTEKLDGEFLPDGKRRKCAVCGKGLKR